MQATQVKGKSLRTMARVLKAVGSAQSVRLVRCVDELEQNVWERLGFPSEIEVGHCIIPSVVGRITGYNANGKEIVRKDLPKESRSVMYYGTTRDWHGGYHSQTMTRSVKAYPREQSPVPAEQLYVIEHENKMYFASSPLELIESEDERNIHTCNMMLECFGGFGLMDLDEVKIVSPQLKRVQWDILPKGKYPWSFLKRVVEEKTTSISSADQEVIKYRLNILSKYEPDFVATGRGGFTGYFVFGFSNLGKYILESTLLGNATYVFDDDWERLSQLSKSEIINGEKHERIIHSRKWRADLKRSLAK